MKLISAKVQNYKSLRNPEPLPLDGGFNVIGGQNNVGKTALIEAMSLQFANKPHRSLVTVPRRDVAPIGASTVEFTYTVSNEEMRNIALVPETAFYVAAPAINQHIPHGHGFIDPSQHLQPFIDWLLAQPNYKFTFMFSPDGVVSVGPPWMNLYNADGGAGTWPMVRVRVTQDRLPILENVTNFAGTAAPIDLSGTTAHHFRSSIYAFRAERLNVGECAVGAYSILSQDASNLAQVIQVLQGTNPRRFQRYNRAVHAVLPQVHEVSTRPLSDGKVQLLVWTMDPNEERDDLAFSLAESGTGVGQVLAILYVVINSDQPKTILIDEPQSFLHPGAVKKLIDILKQHPQHQYILSTHSPAIIAAAKPQTITVVTQNGTESTFQTIDPAQNDAMRAFLLEIGASLSDVFGADNILWVEGPTEELAYPLILEGIATKQLFGTAIIAVKDTGGLEGKHAKSVFEIYDKLSSGRGLLPPAIGFLFDREGRTQQDMTDMQKRSKSVVRFLPRRLFENYLLEPQAIVAVANSCEGFRTNPLTAAEVEQWIEQHRKVKKYGAHDASDDSWVTTIHGAKVLADLFNELSETRVAYDKVVHSVALTKWIIEHNPEHLTELSQLLSEILSAKPT